MSSKTLKRASYLRCRGEGRQSAGLELSFHSNGIVIFAGYCEGREEERPGQGSAARELDLQILEHRRRSHGLMAFEQAVIRQDSAERDVEADLPRLRKQGLRAVIVIRCYIDGLAVEGDRTRAERRDALPIPLDDKLATDCSSHVRDSIVKSPLRLVCRAGGCVWRACRRR